MTVGEAEGFLQQALAVYPRTDEHLLDWIALVTGARIPNRAVCSGHDPPFAFVADFFFQREIEAIVLANRTGGKTFDTAALHLANGYHKPGFGVSHIGAIESQAKRCYVYYRNGLKHELLRDQAPEPHIRDTQWRSGSWIEILPGTEAQTQGGHPNLVTYDELEQGRRQPYENSKAMPVEWRDGSGERHLGQFLATSTRQSSLGLMQRAMDEAETRGLTIYRWCALETMEPCDGQEGRPSCNGAACPIWEWCGPCACGELEGEHGRAVHADGWRSRDEILALYRRSGEDTWLSQHLCQKPEAKSLVYASFTEANVTEEAEYEASGGPLFLAYDWGFTDPYHVAFVQYRDGVFYLFDEMSGNATSERDVVREIVRRVCALDGYRGPSFDEWERVWASAATPRPWPRPWPSTWPDLAAGDPSAVQLRSELKVHGISAKRPAMVKHEVESGQDVLRAAIATAGEVRRLLVHPRNIVTIQAFRNFRARELADGSFDPRPDPDPANHRFSHPTDGLRYLMWVQRRRLGLSSAREPDDREGQGASA